MRFAEISLILALSSVAVAAPHPDGEKTLYKVGTSPRYILARGSGEKVLHKGSASQLLARQTSGESGSAGDSDTCYGVDATCASCFGTNWAPCSDGVTCYDKTDPTSTCSSSGSSGSGSGSSSGSGSGSGSSSGGSAGGSDYCYGVDATCVSCFGAGYLECSDGVTCYNPSDPTTSCPDGTSGTGSGTGTGAGSGTSTGGAGSGLIGISTTATAAGSTATSGGAVSDGSSHTSAAPTTHSSTSTTSTASSTSTSTSTASTSTAAPSPISGNKLGGAAGFSIPWGLSAGAGAAVFVAAALV